MNDVHPLLCLHYYIQLENNNKLQNKITTLIIIVATVFILFAYTETNLEIYAQEDRSN